MGCSLLFFFLSHGFGADTVYLGLDLLLAVGSEGECPEAVLWGCFATSGRNVAEILEPLHAENALQVSTFVPVLLEKRRAHLLGSLRDALPRVEREVGRVLDSLTRDLFVVLVVEGQHSTQEQVSDHAQRPVVNFFAVGLLQQHFRSHVREGAEGVKTGLVWPNDL